MVDRSTVLKLEEIDERAGVDGSVFYLCAKVAFGTRVASNS